MTLPAFPWDFITVYWLSGWFEDHYEIWKGKKDPLASTPQAVHFPINLLFPLKEAEESQLVIIQRENGLVFSIDWFPGEEFEAKAFFSQDRRELLLLSHFEREVILLHLT